MSKKIRIAALFDTDCVAARQGLYVIPCKCAGSSPIKFGPTFALITGQYSEFLRTTKGSPMKIVCSWCRKEGKAEFVGEKAPLDDARETHGICVVHRRDVEARWKASLHTVSRSGVSPRLSSAFFRKWRSVLNVTKKMRP
jgi:hypothetical protein